MNRNFDWRCWVERGKEKSTGRMKHPQAKLLLPGKPVDWLLKWPHFSPSSALQAPCNVTWKLLTTRDGAWISSLIRADFVTCFGRSQAVLIWSLGLKGPHALPFFLWTSWAPWEAWDSCRWREHVEEIPGQQLTSQPQLQPNKGPRPAKISRAISQPTPKHRCAPSDPSQSHKNHPANALIWEIIKVYCFKVLNFEVGFTQQ